MSRLANYHNDRFLAFAFLSVSYMPPNPNFNYERMITSNRSTFGNECYGYWSFFAREDAAAILEAHVSTIFAFTQL